MKERVFSGIQPSGDIHIGNYLGAIKNWVALQEKYECIFCVVDYHAITIPYEPDDMRRRIFNAAADLLACGIDPEKALLFVQSMVPEHTELAWVLSSATAYGDLERMTQFKDKAAQHKKNVNAGLFTYPVLQTADIAIYGANLVPVGEDQLQHLELAREIIRRFNGRFGEVLVEPKEMITKGSRVMGLDGSSKMSKSLNNYIGVMEEKDAVWKKLAGAKTDENRKRREDPGDPEKCNIFSLHKLFNADQETIEWVVSGCTSAGIGCFDCKKRLHENMEAELGPIREKKKEFVQNPEMVYDVLNNSAVRCREIAAATMKTVRDAMGTGLPDLSSL